MESDDADDQPTRGARILEDESEKLDDITSLPGARMLEEDITSFSTSPRESGKPRSYREFVGPTWLRMTLIAMTLGGGMMGVLSAMLRLVVAVTNGLPRNAVATAAGFLALSAFVLTQRALFFHSRRFTRPLMLSLLLQIPVVSSAFIVYDFFAGLQVLLAFLGGSVAASASAGRSSGSNFAWRHRHSAWALTWWHSSCSSS